MKIHQFYPDLAGAPLGCRGALVDIVLVHSLGGHHTKTWQAKDKTVWPKDLLPRNLSNIRVLSFEYGGTIKGTSSKAGIDDTANNLLELLFDKRDEASIRWRPIIFVGHSLGGVIIKRALRIAYYDSRFKSIKNTTLGVVFFATPHQGSAEQFSKLLTNILRCNGPDGAKPTEHMINEIQRNPQLFPFISGDFIHLSNRLMFNTYQEGRHTSLLRNVVVEPAHGTMDVPEEETTRISGDHINLCRFGNQATEEQRFVVVREGIKQMIDDSPRQNKIRARRMKALDSLCSDTLCQSIMAKGPEHGTGDWIFEREEFSSWLRQEPGNSGLWVSGEPGCGKSYLAKHVVDKLREPEQQDRSSSPAMRTAVVCAFLRERNPTNIDAWKLLSELIQQALDTEPELQGRRNLFELLATARKQVVSETQPTPESHPTENNLRGLIATIVRQVLEMAPELIDHILEDYSRKWDKDKPSIAWTLDELKKIWSDVMIEYLKKKKTGLVIIIDGFDKMKRKCQQGFVETLVNFRRTTRLFASLRLLLFSNDYADLQIDADQYGFCRYTIDRIKDTGADIASTVNRNLEVIDRIYEYPPDFREQIREKVPKAADGIYLRADLMLGALKRTRYNEERLAEVLGGPSNGQLHDSPDGLSRRTAELYDHLIDNIWARDENRAMLKDVLLWVAFQQTGLSPAELTVAQVLGRTRESTGARSIPTDEQLRTAQYRSKHTEIWVNRFCGHLIKLERERFEIVHPSFMKYLTTKPDQLHTEYDANVQLPSHFVAYMDAAESHERLGNLCATYLAMPSLSLPVQRKGDTWTGWRAAVERRMKEYKFLRYAALYWTEHLKLARDLAAPRSSIRIGTRAREADLERRRLLEDQSQGNAQSWSEVVCYFHTWHEHEYPKLCTHNANIKHKTIPLMKDTLTPPSTLKATQPAVPGAESLVLPAKQDRISSRHDQDQSDPIAMLRQSNTPPAQKQPESVQKPENSHVSAQLPRSLTRPELSATLVEQSYPVTNSERPNPAMEGLYTIARPAESNNQAGRPQTPAKRSYTPAERPRIIANMERRTAPAAEGSYTTAKSERINAPAERPYTPAEGPRTITKLERLTSSTKVSYTITGPERPSTPAERPYTPAGQPRIMPEPDQPSPHLPADRKNPKPDHWLVRGARTAVNVWERRKARKAGHHASMDASVEAQ